MYCMSILRVFFLIYVSIEGTRYTLGTRTVEGTRYFCNVDDHDMHEICIHIHSKLHCTYMYVSLRYMYTCDMYRHAFSNTRTSTS